MPDSAAILPKHIEKLIKMSFSDRKMNDPAAEQRG